MAERKGNFDRERGPIYAGSVAHTPNSADIGKMIISPAGLSAQVLSGLKSDFDSSYALALLDDACRGDCYLVGGAIRDAAIGAPRSGDLDLIIPNDDFRAYQALDLLGVPFELNSHGNRRYRWNRLQIDIIEPKNFYSGFSTIQATLAFFDLKINAIAIHLGSGALLDPLKGLEQLSRGRVGINWPRWDAMPPEELMVLLIRLVRVLSDIKALTLALQDAIRLTAEIIPRVRDLDWAIFRHRFPPGKERFFQLLVYILQQRERSFQPA